MSRLGPSLKIVNDFGRSQVTIRFVDGSWLEYVETDKKSSLKVKGKGLQPTRELLDLFNKGLRGETRVQKFSRFNQLLSAVSSFDTADALFPVLGGPKWTTSLVS